MISYFLILALSLLIFFISLYCSKHLSNYSHYFFVPILIVLLSLFSALRHYDVGTDTINYMLILSKGFGFSELSLFSEPIFNFYNIIINRLPFSFEVRFFFYLFFIAFLILILYFRCIFDYSDYPGQTLILFFLLGIYTFHFNGIRQAVTIVVFLFAYRFVITRQLFKYVFTLVLGFFIHKSIILMLPFYWIVQLGLNRKTVFFICLASVVSALLIQPIVDLASTYDTRYSGYADDKYGSGGLVSVLFYSSILAWLLLSMKLNGINNHLYKTTILAMFIATCIGWTSVALSLNPSGILRLVIYFIQFSIFALPVSIMSFRSPSTRVFLIISIYGILTFYYYLTTSQFSGLYPYKTSIESLL